MAKFDPMDGWDYDQVILALNQAISTLEVRAQQVSAEHDNTFAEELEERSDTLVRLLHDLDFGKVMIVKGE